MSGDGTTLGLPASIRACLFDLDGVLTRTAAIHATAWKDVFDEFLRERSAQLGVELEPFDIEHDYSEFVDGKQRNDGVRSFLAARDIVLPEGSADDPPAAETVAGIGNRKNERAVALIRVASELAYEGSLRFVDAVREAGLATAVVSASANCREVLEVAGIAGLFDAKVDAVSAQRDHLRGKPAPDTFLAAARLLGISPGEAAVFEDSLAGVEAGRAGRFGLVVGVDRVGHREALRARGADIVVGDLVELLD
jgi:beta-phosphoglucomutase family hydrolase